MLLLDHSPMTSYFQEINETTLLNQEDERELARRVQEGDTEARDRMVKANLRLVVAIARRFAGRGMCLSDLIQEGNLGLVHAVERFDPAQNTRFSTYAKFWIEEGLGRALEKMTGPVRVPAYANELLANWRRAANDLHKKWGRHPTDEEIADRLKLAPRQLAIVQKAQRIHNNVAHLCSQDERGTAANELVDSRCQAPDAGLAADDELRHVLASLEKLPPRDVSILRLRYGLGGKDPMTLAEIGQQLDLTRERVRQLEHEALAKLRDFLTPSD
jgi:RNA polymerase primary sigma factor